MVAVGVLTFIEDGGCAVGVCMSVEGVLTREVRGEVAA